MGWLEGIAGVVLALLVIDAIVSLATTGEWTPFRVTFTPKDRR